MHSDLKFFVKRIEGGYEVRDSSGRCHGFQHEYKDAKQLLTIVQNMFLASFGGQWL